MQAAASSGRPPGGPGGAAAAAVPPPPNVFPELRGQNGGRLLWCPVCKDNVPAGFWHVHQEHHAHCERLEQLGRPSTAISSAAERAESAALLVEQERVRAAEEQRRQLADPFLFAGGQPSLGGRGDKWQQVWDDAADFGAAGPGRALSLGAGSSGAAGRQLRVAAGEVQYDQQQQQQPNRVVVGSLGGGAGGAAPSRMVPVGELGMAESPPPRVAEITTPTLLGKRKLVSESRLCGFGAFLSKWPA